MHSTPTGSVVMLPTIAPLNWQEQRPRLVAIGLVILLLAALFAFFNLDQFYVFDVEAPGLSHLTKDEVQKASGTYGYNLFFIEPTTIQRALSKIPEVKSVQISMALPNQLTILVQERQPEITWLRGNESFWIDSDGVAMRVHSNKDLGTLRDTDQAPLKPGQSVPAGVMQAMHALYRAWKEAPRTLEWSSSRGLGFVDQHGWKIYLGDSSDMSGKLFKYHVIMAQLLTQNAKIKSIDLGRGDPFYQ